MFEGKKDMNVHLQFQKFSKGEFENRAGIKAKSSGGKYTINTTAEFANDFVREIAEKLGDKKTNITGAIISTQDLKKDLSYKEIKQFQGVKRYLIEEEKSGKEIINLLNKFPKAFFALSFSAGESELKIKPKAPKSGKPGNKEKQNPNFCKLITKDSELGKSFVFEKPNFKMAEINHKFIIIDIEIPDELKNSQDFAKIREESFRVGKIVREAIIDGEEIKSEWEFRV